MDRPVTIFGKLHVGEYRENGQLLRPFIEWTGKKWSVQRIPGEAQSRATVKRQKIRKAKALAAANRRAYLGLAIGAAVGIALFAMALLVVPIGSPSQMVKAQMVHKKATESALKTHTMPTPPAVASMLRPASPPTREATSSHSQRPGRCSAGLPLRWLRSVVRLPVRGDGPDGGCAHKRRRRLT